jgi:hypothetical protein
MTYIGNAKHPSEIRVRNEAIAKCRWEAAMSRSITLLELRYSHSMRKTIAEEHYFASKK